MIFKSDEFKGEIKRLFLDDIRHPTACLGYMQPRIGQNVAE